MSFIVRKAVSPGDLNRFLRFGAEIYRRDPYRVEPSPSDTRKKFDPAENPFFEHAEVQPFLCERGGRTVGRVAAIIDARQDDPRQEKAASFGFFECIDDGEAARTLFDAAGSWAAERGARVLRGPANFSSHDDWGLLVTGFDSSPALMMPYNPAYYEKLLTTSGFVPDQDLFAYHLPVQREIPAFIRRTAEKVRHRRKPVVRYFDPLRFEEEVNALSGLLAVPAGTDRKAAGLTESEIRYRAVGLRRFIEPSLCPVVELNGRPAAFALCLPDYNQAFNKKGILRPETLSLALGRHRITALRLMAVFIDPAFRRAGLESLLYLAVWESAKKLGLIDAEISWIAEEERSVRNGLLRAGAVVAKTYRLYRRKI